MTELSNKPGLVRRSAPAVLLAVCSIGAQSLSAQDMTVLSLRGYAQEAEDWCWAASAQSVLRFLAPDLGEAVCQCRQAESRLDRTECCQSGTSCLPRYPLAASCGGPGWPHFADYGFDFKTTCDPLLETDWEECVRPPLSWPDLSREIRQGRAVVSAFRPAARQDIGHTVVAFGILTTEQPESRWVLVFDPKRMCRTTCDRKAPPCCHEDAWWISYDQYRAFGGDPHWITFFAFQRKTSGQSQSRAEGSQSRTAGRQR